MTTLKEVAAAAGVHLATASAVLNRAGGNTRVGEETRARVLEAARRLAYIPNETARRLRRKVSDTVGFLGGDWRNPFFAELGAALERELATHGLQLMILHVAETGAGLHPAITLLQRQGVERIIVWEEGEATAPPGAPLRLLPIGFSRKKRPGIWLDLEAAVALAVGVMVERGYRQLGFYAPRQRGESPSVGARQNAFRAACRRLRLPAPVVTFFEGEAWDLEAATQGATVALRQHPEVEAWIGFNDLAALGLLNQMPRSASRRVFCFDGTALTRCHPGSPAFLDLQIATLANLCAQRLAQPHPGEEAIFLRPQRFNH